MKHLSVFVGYLAFASMVPWLPAAQPDKKAGGFKQVLRADIDVIDGKVGENKDGFLTIDSPEVRGQHKATGARAARMVFTYHGETKEVAKLASGNIAHQLGLKLRAKNTCNLLYVMWKIEDKERIVVSVKSNPGQSTHKECGANGYTGIKPVFQERPERFPSVKDGKQHTLEAELSKKKKANNYELVVKADGKFVWQGLIDEKMLDGIDGPAGFRSDNAAFTFKFYSLAP